MRHLTIATLVALIVNLCADSSWAWNDVGHLTIARIAWDHLNDDHREAVVAILRQHPHYEQYLAKDRPADVSEAEWVFLRAATWPDHVRSPRNLSREHQETHPLYRFHRSTWHYVNYPYHVGQPSGILPSEPVTDDEPDAAHLLDQLILSMRIVANPTTEDPDRVAGLSNAQNRAVRLCWLFHLLGDVHQPLHVTTLVDRELFHNYDHSDRGGNSIMIRSHRGASPSKLHAFWDDRLGTNSHFPKIRDLAESLSHDPHFAPTSMQELSIHTHVRDWAAESYSLATTEVYLNGRLSFARTADYEEKRITADDVPLLPVGAEQHSNQIARRRVAIAGYRLAQKIIQIFPR